MLKCSQLTLYTLCIANVFANNEFNFDSGDKINIEVKSKKFPDFQALQSITKLTKKELEDCIKWIQKNENHYVYEYASKWISYYHILPKLINEFNLKIGCEIGVAFGTHSLAILKQTHIEKLYSIDPYLYYGWPPCPSPKASQYFDVLFYRVKDALSEYGNKSSLLRMPSVEAAKLFSENSLDFVFIDAMHNYEGIMSDLNAWYNKIKSKGIIAGDDYTSSWPGLIKGLHEFFGKKNITIYRDKDQPRIWWTFKP